MRLKSQPLARGEVREARHSKTFTRAGFGGGLVGLVYLLTLAQSTSNLLPLYLGMLASFGIIGGSVALNRRRRLATSAVAHFTDEHLVFTSEGDAVRRVARDAITGGYFDGHGRLTLVLKDGTQLDYGCDEEQSQQLLDEAGVSATQRTLRLKTASAASAWRGGQALATTAGVPAIVISLAFSLAFVLGITEGWLLEQTQLLVWWLMWWFGSSAAWWLTHRVTAPRTVVIGSDALVLEGAFRTRKIALTEIAHVEENDADVTLVLHSDERVELRAHVDRSVLEDMVSERADARRALGRRIHEALTHNRVADVDPEQARQLERGGRSDDDWRAALLTLSESSARYRERGLSRERRARIVLDATRSAEQRIGAAISLSDRQDEHWRVIDEAASVTADTEIANALRGAAIGALPTERIVVCVNQIAGSEADETDAREVADQAIDQAAEEELDEEQTAAHARTPLHIERR